MLAIAGLAGFLLGLGHADWQWAVEHAQVMSGLVAYPPDSPQAIAHARVWSLTSQASALLLSLGASEILISKLLSGLLGLISLTALASVVFAFSRNGILAIGAVFVIIISRLTDYGAVYPIALFGTAHTHGAMGLSFGVLAAGLLGMGWIRTGAFLVALSPAVHTALGVWLVATAGLAFVAADRESRALLFTGWKAFAAGAVLAAVSFAAHWALAPEVPPIDPAAAERYLRSFVAFWDGHRQPVDLTSDGVRLSAGVVLLAVIWIGWFGRGLQPGARFLLRLLATSGVLSLALAAWSAAAPESLPSALVAFMPGRVLNVTVVCAGALVLGLLGAMTERRATQVLLVLVVLALIGSNRSLLWAMLGTRLWRLDALSVLAFATAGLIGVAVLARARASRALHGAVVAVMTVAAAVVTLDAMRGLPSRAAIFRDRTNDPVFEAASRGSGPLLTGGELFLIQLRTRRPVLLDGGTLDTLPYALESGPAMEAILRDVYGVDLFNPPEEARGGGRVPARANRDAWARYSRDRWLEIGRRYGVTQVVTPDDWTIDLPPVASSAGLRLYEIR